MDGSLEDPHQEFFVASEASVQGEEEAIWHHKYSVRKAMIPRFITYAWSKKILSTGLCRRVSIPHALKENSDQDCRYPESVTMALPKIMPKR